jgi:iron complex transport system substrate-binding protein
VFPEFRDAALAKHRICDPAEVARRDPQVILASWCGKAVRKSRIRTRPGWDTVSAVRDDCIYEVKSSYILQPGPASLTEGVRQVHAQLARAVGAIVDDALRPQERMDGGELRHAPRNP